MEFDDCWGWGESATFSADEEEVDICCRPRVWFISACWCLATWPRWLASHFDILVVQTFFEKDKLSKHYVFEEVWRLLTLLFSPPKNVQFCKDFFFVSVWRWNLTKEIIFQGNFLFGSQFFRRKNLFGDSLSRSTEPPPRILGRSKPLLKATAWFPRLVVEVWVDFGLGGAVFLVRHVTYFVVVAVAVGGCIPGGWSVWWTDVQCWLCFLSKSRHKAGTKRAQIQEQEKSVLSPRAPIRFWGCNCYN